MLEKANQMNLDINVIVSNLLPLPKSSKFQRFYEEKSSLKFLPHLIKAHPVKIFFLKKSFLKQKTFQTFKVDAQW